MSYEIIYDKQFVKANDKFIPMILAGSNNLTEWSPSGKERRVRNWWNFSYLLDGALAGTKEQMLKKQEEVKQGLIERRGDDYDDKSFGYYMSLSINGGGCNATYGQYKGIVNTGCKKALTVEQLIEENVHLNIHTYSSDDTKKQLKEQGLEPVSFTPNSTEQLIDFIENIEPKYKGKKGGNLYISFSGMYESKPKWIRRKHFPPKPKPSKVVVKSTCGYTVKATDNKGVFVGYLTKYHGGAFRYSPYSKTDGKQFLDKKKAERWANKIRKRRDSYKFEVILVEYGRERGFLVTEKEAENLTLPTPEPEIEYTDEELIDSLELREEGEEVANIFDPEQKCFLDPLGVALHDFVKGCEVTGKHQKMEQGLRIFREKYPEEYYTLLD